MTVYGPLYRLNNIPGLLYKQTWWYRRKPITSAPLQFDMDAMVNEDRVTSDYTTWSHTALHPSNLPTVISWENEIYRKAYGRFREGVDDYSSQLGADFAERKSSMKALTTRTMQLVKAARSLKALNVRGFLKALGVKRRTVRKSASDMGGLWLEYSFGWKPLVEDIWSAVMVLQRPMPRFSTCTGKAHASKVVSFSEGTGIYLGQYDRSTFTTAVMLKADVSVSNWVAWKANELGLINPLSVAWEVVPFSFVADWFIPVGGFLQSLTDFVGLSFSNSMITWYAVERNDRYWRYPSWHHNIKKRATVMRRLVIPSPPELQSRFTGFYSARGANAIALLSQALRDLPDTRRHINF
jgi:hypothetical protein